VPSDLPNLLTLSRIAAIPLIAALMLARVPAADLAACALFTAAAVTDWLDGKLARARGITSELGRMLDPIADKLLVGATLMLLAGLGRLSDLGVLAAVVIMLREIMVSGLREFLAGLSVGLPVTALAKWKTGVQMTALGMLVAGDGTARLLGLEVLPVPLLGEALLLLAAALTLVTGWDYLAAGLKHVRRDAPEEGRGRPAAE
jgi:cardiolipin synthase